MARTSASKKTTKSEEIETATSADSVSDVSPEPAEPPVPPVPPDPPESPEEEKTSSPSPESVSPVLANKSVAFAQRLISMYCYISQKRNEHIISQRVLESGIEIGKHIRRSEEVKSIDLFFEEINQASLKAAETLYFLDLLLRGRIITQEQYISIRRDCDYLYHNLRSMMVNNK